MTRDHSCETCGRGGMNDPVYVLERELERERMRLVACGVAALANTPKTVADRITKDHPYWSASYGDVCDAVDCEMELRARVRELEAFVAVWDYFDHHTRCGCVDCDGNITTWREHQDEYEKKVDEARAALAKAKTP